MTPRPDISKPENMLAIQGDTVFVYKADNPDPILLLTLVRVIDVDHQEMRLVNKELRICKPDWIFTQVMYDRLRPAKPNKEGAKWEMTIK